MKETLGEVGGAGERGARVREVDGGDVGRGRRSYRKRSKSLRS